MILIPQADLALEKQVKERDDPAHRAAEYAAMKVKVPDGEGRCGGGG